MTAPSRSDPRPVWFRLLVWSGFAVGALVSVPLLVIGLVVIDDGRGKFALCFGLVLVVTTVGGLALEVAERRLIRNPVEPRLDSLVGGEPALLLPRATAPTAISSAVLVGFAATLAFGAVLAATELAWGLCVALALAAGWLVHLAAPLRTVSMAGGMWLTPSSIVDEYRGIRWDVAWEDVTGVEARHPTRILLVVRGDRVPRIRRTGPRGRAWNPLTAGNVLAVDSSHLAGGSALAGSLIGRGLEDPAFRREFGTPTSLPARGLP